MRRLHTWKSTCNKDKKSLCMLHKYVVHNHLILSPENQLDRHLLWIKNFNNHHWKKERWDGLFSQKGYTDILITLTEGCSLQ